MKQPSLVLSRTTMLCALLTSLSLSSFAQEPTTRNLHYGNISGTIAGLDAHKFEPHGPLTMRYPNGDVALRGQLDLGSPTGKWQRWYPNGHLFGEYSYRDGALDGHVAQYWDKGSLARFGHYDRGMPSGQLLFFSRDKKLIKRVFFVYNSSKRLVSTHYRYICVVRKSVPRCKTILDIEHDLGTIISPDQVASVLAGVDTIYDLLGLDETADALISCSPDRITAKRAGGLVVDSLAGFKKAELNRVGWIASVFGDVRRGTSLAGLSDLAASACNSLGAGVLTGGGAGSDPSKGLPGGLTGSGDIGRLSHSAGEQNAIDNAKAKMSKNIQNCHESTADKWLGTMSPGYRDQAYGATASNPVAWGAIALGVAAFVAAKIGDELFDYVTNDGYADHGARLDDGTIKYTSNSNSNDYKIVNETEHNTSFHTTTDTGATDSVVYDEPTLDGSGWFIHQKWTKTDKDGNVVEEGEIRSLPQQDRPNEPRHPGNPQRVVSKKNADNTWTTTESEDGKVTRTTTKDEQGNVINVVNYKDGKPIPSTSSASGTGTPGASMPEEAGSGSRCQRAAAAWARFEASCDAAGWKTYTCQKFVASINGCADPAEIQPTPEGGGVCERTSQADREQAERAACERKKGLMLPSGEGNHDVCDKPDLAAELPSVDICSDPAAMCRPEAMAGLDGLSSVMPQP